MILTKLICVAEPQFGCFNGVASGKNLNLAVLGGFPELGSGKNINLISKYYAYFSTDTDAL